MRLSYNDIAGKSVERLAALSDGIFALAMTLLVLDLRTPAANAIHSERDLWQALFAMGPQIVMYLMSFITLGIFWVCQQTTQSPEAGAPEFGVDAHFIFVLGDADAVFDALAGAVLSLSARLACLRDEYLAWRRGVVLQLELRGGFGTGEGGLARGRCRASSLRRPCMLSARPCA